MNSRPRVALVGCGAFACAAHIPALRRLEKEGHIELVALCSRSEESLSCASKLCARGDLKKYTKIHDVTADPNVDMVDLVLPISTTSNAIKESLRSGKHVISEKPCAPIVSDGVELLNFYSSLENPPLWAVAENWRFKNTTKIIEKIVTSGAIGKIHFADFQHMTFAGPENLGWRGSPDYPGGFLLDSGVHFVALLRKVVGEVERVSATVSQRLAHLPPADSVTAVLSFAGGAEGCFRLSFAAREAGRQPGLSLIGSEGAVFADFRRSRTVDLRRNWIKVRGSAGKRLIYVANDP
jgi:predicted dehydrogenase